MKYANLFVLKCLEQNSPLPADFGGEVFFYRIAANFSTLREKVDLECREVERTIATRSSTRMVRGHLRSRGLWTNTT